MPWMSAHPQFEPNHKVHHPWALFRETTYSTDEQHRVINQQHWLTIACLLNDTASALILNCLVLGPENVPFLSVAFALLSKHTHTHTHESSDNSGIFYTYTYTVLVSWARPSYPKRERGSDEKLCKPVAVLKYSLATSGLCSVYLACILWAHSTWPQAACSECSTAWQCGLVYNLWTA